MIHTRLFTSLDGCIMEDIFLSIKMWIIILQYSYAGDMYQIIYPQTAKMEIRCIGSEIINIVDVKLKKATDNTCNLTDIDRRIIKECFQNTKCTEPLEQSSPCFAKKRNFSVNYFCKRNAHACDFENGQCNWKGNGNWKRVKVNQRLSITDRDHTTGSKSGHLMYVKTLENGTVSRLESSVIARNKEQCLTFWFHSEDSSRELKLERYINSSCNCVLNNSWIINKSDKYSWKKIEYELTDIGDFWLAFTTVENATLRNYKTGFAIDDILITNSKCQMTSCIDCNFESDNCGWSVPSRWKRWNKNTLTGGTGPLTDHTTTFENKGYYLYMDSSNMSNFEKVNFTSTTITKRGELCLVFWYYMFGKHMGSLNVYYESDTGHSVKLFSKSNNQGQRWHSAHIDINVGMNFKVAIEGTRGNGIESEIAIDDIILLSGDCKGYVSYHKGNNGVEEQISLDECYSHYLPMENITFDFHSKKDNCTAYTAEQTKNICSNSSSYTYCDMRAIAKQNASCYYFNALEIKYTCAETTVTNGNDNSGNTDYSFGFICGVVVGVVAMICSVCIVVFIYRRRRTDELLVRQSTVNYSTPSWSADNVEGKVVYSKSEKNDSRQTGDEYTIIDRADIGIIKRIKVTANKSVVSLSQNVDGDYAESISSRHKVNDTIHSMDNTYDTGNQGRHFKDEDYTYDHMFGKLTEDEYDIARP